MARTKKAQILNASYAAAPLNSNESLAKEALFGAHLYQSTGARLAHIDAVLKGLPVSRIKERVLSRSASNSPQPENNSNSSPAESVRRIRLQI